MIGKPVRESVSEYSELALPNDANVLGNLLGALSLVITDRLADATTGAAGQSVTAATALSALHHFLDRPTIDRACRPISTKASTLSTNTADSQTE